MQDQRDDSIWKTLAVAFGDGIAFGAGMNLSRNAASRISAGGSPRPDMRALGARLSEIENRIERARQTNMLPGAANLRVAEAVVGLVDERLREHSARVEQRLAAMEAKIDARAAGLEGLRDDFNGRMEDSFKRHQDDIQILRSQMAELHRQFAQSVARLVDEQIIKTLEVRLDPLEKQLKDEIRQQNGRALSLLASATEDCVRERVEPLQAEATELRQRMEASDQNALELVVALGQFCVAAAERLSLREPEEPVTPEPAATTPITAVPVHTAPAAPPAPTEAPEAPAETKPGGSGWRIPMVSSFLFVTGGLLLLHYL